MRVLGVDPGLYGAVAMWDDDLEALVIRDTPIAKIQKGKSTSRVVMLDAELARIVRALGPDRAIVEEVGGVTGQSASASFNFGRVAGVVHGVLASLGVPLTFVTPPVWRAAWLVPPGKDGSRLRASQLFPRYAQLFARKSDDGRAEAALIARLKI